MRYRLAHFLRHIPQSNQEALPIAAIIADNHIDDESLFIGVSQFLDTLGVVDFDADNETIRASSQTSKYTLNSLAEYLQSDLKIVTDWQTRGVLRDPNAGPLQNGASFLHMLEAQRLAIQQNPPATRIERVAQVLIKRTNPHTGEPELLFQYDQNANQYQLIGGRWRENDGDILNTIVREIEEELEDNILIYGQNYQLDVITDDFIPPSVLSPTFGALTEYHFWVYHMVGLDKPLILQKNDRWVTVSQMLSGTVIDDTGVQYPFQNMDIYYAINSAVTDGLASLPDSWSSEHNSDN